MHRKEWWRKLVYVAAFLFPFFGIVYGMFETTREDAASRRRGKWVVILGVSGLVTACVAAAMWLILTLRTGLAAAYLMGS